MRRFILTLSLAASALGATALPAAAEVRFLAFDAADRTTQALTRGVTLEVERGWFGATTVKNLFSSTSRGSARFVSGGPDQVRRVLPKDAAEGGIYAIAPEGDGRALGRALCPGSDESWIVVGRVRAGRPLTLQAVGRWADGQFRRCVALNYVYRGEWSTQPGAGPARDAPAAYGPN
ncbi:hypothetical protein D8I30_05620 [Brevundimonas naejangsanensis]|uniref:DUF4864 domain-containing protein n=1 Tax=Brevundimonas naejangsanensis TaxID=588932 RepID=A0A494RLJ5_9CAUL|nr:hypothetical protein [Brevundimonas naejangsanensis]AYG96299.1 hypothetical protein D8I30_05620 [Brevundimonas naejangsanensis]